MPKHLVIVESPGKIKSIERYLKNFSQIDNDDQSTSIDPDTFKVVSSYGHVRDLPSKGLNLEPEANWKANYQLLPDKQKVVDKLRQEAKNAALVFLATDLDREGEAIAWHLREVIGGEDDRFVRVVFNEITESAIHKAFSERGHIDENRVNAQQARRFLDRVVGYKLTPLLYQKIARGLSAGRVQSVAVRLVVEREREIRVFKPKEYWDVFADLRRENDGASRRFQVARENDANFEVNSEADANAVLAAIKESNPTVASITKRNSESRPSAPFITSTLQQSASSRFSFPVARTMRLAQSLYEAGLITYMRTDSTSISDDARESAASLVRRKYGDSYLPAKPNQYKSKSNAQEAHEAIRPSDVTVEPDAAASALTSQRMSSQDRAAASRLYELIWRQFIASQMTPARYENTTVGVKAERYELRLSGRRTLFDGHTRVSAATKSEESEPDLPQYQEGEVLHLVGLEKKQHFTKPPARYSEAGLVRELERRGIGRPSTYSSIISTIKDRGYVSVRGRRFYAERIAEVVTDRLVECFNELLSYEFTAEMEERLDEVALGEKRWIDLLNEYHDDFVIKLDAAGDKDAGMRPNTPIQTDIECEKCGRPMTIRVASTGTFLGCSGYSAPAKDRCRNTIDLVSDENTVRAGDDDEAEADENESRRLLAKRHCGKCGSAMDGYMMNEQFKLHICGNAPTCGGFELEPGEFMIAGYDGPIVECNKCGHDMQLKAGRFGKFFGCTNETCGNTRKLLKTGDVAAPPIHMEELQVPDEEDYFVLREGSAGIFLGASRYPKVRVIRKPRVKELISHANELDPKFSYMLSAPREDERGNDTFIHFARKTREHYLTSMKADKDTGWRAYFKNGAWEAIKPQSKKRKSSAKKRTDKKS
ncbi:MAG: type I DNA topoisomerase [Gammaproteobacteria bacterium]|nr:type I DNA topoisomerase [Gammaproteobacteria bacterium]